MSATWGGGSAPATGARAAVLDREAGGRATSSTTTSSSGAAAAGAADDAPQLGRAHLERGAESVGAGVGGLLAAGAGLGTERERDDADVAALARAMRRGAAVRDEPAAPASDDARADAVSAVASSGATVVDARVAVYLARRVNELKREVASLREEAARNAPVVAASREVALALREPVSSRPDLKIHAAARALMASVRKDDDEAVRRAVAETPALLRMRHSDNGSRCSTWPRGRTPPKRAPRSWPRASTRSRRTCWAGRRSTSRRRRSASKPAASWSG